MYKILLIGLLLFAGCAAKTAVSVNDIYPYKAQVAKCMGLDPTAYGTVHVDTVSESTVSCDNRQAAACYHAGTITIPTATTESTLKHEFVHFFVDKALGGGDDPKHTVGGSFYLKCGGIEVE